MALRSSLAMLGIATCLIGTSIALEAAAPATQKAEVVERDSRGRATSVQIDGTVYKVCTAQITDSCINPRQAGLNFGNQPLGHWPDEPTGGKPAKK
ncbi:hypothetical protein EDF56_105516 [Novosphingobium sp. PhB165]|uniref:hypothetical protein n=1 Tax=Novosphingobium sp. PhB165 TaxID=2485105 RepID=UPI00105264F7|nr:hypothetical protein [Novosphingobium sp. PhB165]TCM18165.1 hypothetical protein EDF56_105516 [Novosphingobium sp. PhB165]